MTQVQEIGFKAVAGVDDLARQLHQPEGLRHLTRAGLVVPRSTAHKENPAPCGRVALLPFRGEDRLTRVEPLQRQLELGIGKAGPSLSIPGVL